MSKRKARAACRRYYRNHRDEMLLRAKRYYAEHREAVVARMRRYRGRPSAACVFPKPGRRVAAATSNGVTARGDGTRAGLPGGDA